MRPTQFTAAQVFTYIEFYSPVSSHLPSLPPPPSHRRGSRGSWHCSRHLSRFRGSNASAFYMRLRQGAKQFSWNPINPLEDDGHGLNMTEALVYVRRWLSSEKSRLSAGAISRRHLSEPALLRLCEAAKRREKKEAWWNRSIRFARFPEATFLREMWNVEWRFHLCEDCCAMGGKNRRYENSAIWGYEIDHAQVWVKRR